MKAEMIEFDIEELRRWQLDGDRTVVIRLGDGDKEKVSAYCYDRSLEVGQSIDKSVDELNLNREIERINKERIEWIESLKED